MIFEKVSWKIVWCTDYTFSTAKLSFSPKLQKIKKNNIFFPLRIAWLSKEGSPGCSIERCDLNNFEYLARQEFKGFTIRFWQGKQSVDEHGMINCQKCYKRINFSISRLDCIVCIQHQHSIRSFSLPFISDLRERCFLNSTLGSE